MFIDKVMREIWKEVDKEYKASYEEAKKLSAEAIYQRHCNDVMRFNAGKGVTMNYVDTIGCPYRMKGGTLSGCSMCDFQSEHARRQGSFLALKEKSPNLYGELILRIFKNGRGNESPSNIIENISGYDTFNNDEIPESVCSMIFGAKLFEDEPYIYSVETRASSINRARLERFKRNVSNKRRVSIDFGVEVSNEWIRNEWLNKSVTNQQIVDATNLLHEYGFSATGNALIGVPGFTEEQSVNLFIETVMWMDNIGIDKIVVHPLNRKKYTLQGYLHDTFENDTELLEVGLVQRGHTGLPWLFTIIYALKELHDRNPGVYKKLRIMTIDEKNNSIANQVSYNSKPDCTCNDLCINLINHLMFDRGYDALGEIKKKLTCDQCLASYMDLLEKQKKCGSWLRTVTILGKKIAKHMFPENWEGIYSELLKSVEAYIDEES